MSMNAPPPEGAPDKQTLKRALEAFRKRLEVWELDAPSTISSHPNPYKQVYVSGQRSTIVGIVPPKEFPQVVWDELERQGKIKNAGYGTYELVRG
jgi:hypothetical protein